MARIALALTLVLLGALLAATPSATARPCPIDRETPYAVLDQTVVLPVDVDCAVAVAQNTVYCLVIEPGCLLWS